MWEKIGEVNKEKRKWKRKRGTNRKRKENLTKK